MTKSDFSPHTGYFPILTTYDTNSPAKAPAYHQTIAPQHTPEYKYHQSHNAP